MGKFFSSYQLLMLSLFQMVSMTIVSMETQIIYFCQFFYCDVQFLISFPTRYDSCWGGFLKSANSMWFCVSLFSRVKNSV